MPAVTKLNISKAAKMRFLNGNTYQEIADIYGISKQSVQQSLKPFADIMQGKEILKTYQENYSDILRNANMQLMQAMHDPDKIAGASLNNVAYAFNTVANHLRLEENKSTDNVGFKGMIDHIKKSADDLDTMQDALSEQLFADP